LSFIENQSIIAVNKLMITFISFCTNNCPANTQLTLLLSPKYYQYASEICPCVFDYCQLTGSGTYCIKKDPVHECCRLNLSLLQFC